MDAWGRRHAGDRLVLCLLGLGVTAAYLAFERGSLGAWDGRSMASVARNLLEHHSLKQCCNAFGAFPLDRGPYSKFAIGFSLVLVPFWFVQLHVDPNGALWLGVANPLLLAAATVVIAKVGLLLGWRRPTAVLAALAFAFATMAPVYSTEFFAEPGVTFAVMLVILGLVLWPSVPQRGALAVGAGVMTAILFRFDSVLLVAPTALCAPLFHSRRALATTWKRVALPLGLPIAIAIAWTLFYNQLRFGHAFQFGYSGVYDRAGFSTPLLRGTALLLVSPGQSFFLYAPVLLAALPGVVWLARRRSHVAAAIVLLCVLRVLFFARWWTPAGGDGWGPRFLLPLCALLAVGLGETLEHVRLLHGLRKWSAVSVISGSRGREPRRAVRIDRRLLRPGVSPALQPAGCARDRAGDGARATHAPLQLDVRPEPHRVELPARDRTEVREHLLAPERSAALRRRDARTRVPRVRGRGRAGTETCCAAGRLTDFNCEATCRAASPDVPPHS
ncbi:MAG TPA: hypothetical protein VIK61_10425 [Acidimicrobiia bacterium]